MLLKGSIVALVTPMHEDGTIDEQALHELVEWHIESGTDGLVIAGTTGESATLEPDEHFYLLQSVIKKVAKRLPVIAGTGTNSTKTTLKLTDNAKKAGADACLVVTPYYNKPTQNGLYHHFKMVAENVELPMILYNVPSRTSCDLLAETVSRLSKLKNIIGIKEATGKVERATEIRKDCPANFHIFSGDDLTSLSLMEAGAQGVISVTANVAPKKMHALCQAALKGNFSEAHQLNDELKLLHQFLFLESNPIPTKWALQQMGKIKAGIRLPLMPLDKKYHQEVKKAMHYAGVD